MSRRISADLINLIDFLNKYTLDPFTKNRTQIDLAKSMHKKLYCFMIFIAEFEKQTKFSDSVIFLKETASDVLLALFNWIQGMYKPSKLILRCSIEDFVKALLLINNANIVLEKSVYKIFDSAKTDKHFISSYGAKQINQLESDYSILCGTVHSDPQKINSTSALLLLPQYDASLSNECRVIFLRLIEAQLATLYINYPEVIDSMHPENRKDFLDGLADNTKKEIVEMLYG